MSDRSPARVASSAKPAAPPVTANRVLQRQGVHDREPQGPGSLGTTDGEAARAVTPPPLTPPTGGARAKGGRGFAGLKTETVSRTIHDGDAARAMVTQWLVEELAPLLGIDPRRIEIRTDQGAEARTNAHGANGLVEGETLYLHPGRFRPQTPEGRRLLAHEATHLAQRELPGPADAPEAEREAAQIARAFEDRRPFTRPTRPLDRLAVACDKGATELEATTVAAPQKPPPPPLTTSVRESRSREIDEIKNHLDVILYISDGDVSKVMQILDEMPYPVRVAVVHELGDKTRYRLADNINPPHLYAHRSSVLACYDALEPGQYGAVDLKVLRALPLSGLTTEETTAARKTLSQLSNDDRTRLLESTNRVAIERIILGPGVSEAEKERVKKEAEKAATSEQEQAEARRKISAQKDKPETTALLEQVRQLLIGGEKSGTDHPPSVQDAEQALELLEGAKGEESRFLYVAEQLEREGLINALLQLLPPDSFYDAVHSDTLVRLVQSRRPTRNAQLLEDLLSRGLFDWAIRDYEALFAYRLIKLMPLSEQYRFRQRDAGKWYLRLLAELPENDPVTKKAFEGLEIRKAESKEELKALKAEGLVPQDVDEEGLYYNASKVYAHKLEGGDAGQKLKDLIEAFEKGVSREQAKSLYLQLVSLGAGSLEKGHEKPDDLILREAIIHTLDSKKLIEKLFDALPDSFLFSEENRISTVKIMLARDPARVQEHARRLVSRGFFDWMVTDGEAYLAHLCVIALPQDERDGFIQANPDQWGRIQSEMSEAQRQARDTNLYVGDKAGTDRASVLGQLALEETWDEKNVSLLDGLLRMAVAMTERKFAFMRSAEFNATAKKALQPLVDKYLLYDRKAGRTEYKAQAAQGTKWYEEGVFDTLRTVGSAINAVWNTDVVSVEGKIGFRVDLNKVQNVLGGDLMGAKLSDPKANGAKLPEAHPGSNKVTLLIGEDLKSASVSLPELRIDSANIQMGGSTVQTGSVVMKGLHLSAAYDSEKMSQPTRANAEVDSLEANDLLLAKSSSMVSVVHLGVEMLRVAAGTMNALTRTPDSGKEKSIPFPLLVPHLLGMFVLFGLPAYIFSKIAGLFSQGLESDLGGHFAGDVAASTKALQFSFNQLDVEGLTTSGGQHVGHVGVRDFAVRAGLNKPTRLRAEKASVDQRLAALASKPEAAEAVAKLRERRSAIDKDLGEVEKQEMRYLEIRRRILKGGLKPEEQSSLQQELDGLNFEDKGAAFIDIGSVEASGISGNITSEEPIKLSNIHGEGGGAALTQFVALPTMTNQQISEFSGGDKSSPPLLHEGQEGAISIELGDIQTGKISVSGGIRSVHDIDEKIKELEPLKATPEIAPLYESLGMLREKAARYEIIVQHGISTLTGWELADYIQLRQDLTAQASLIIKSINLTQAQLDVDVATGRVKFGVAAGKITGVQLAEKGVEVDEIIVRSLGVGAVPTGGLLNWQDWKKNIKDADGRVDLLQFTGVRDRYHGLLFQKATFSGPYAKLKDRGDFVNIGLKKLSVEGVGIAPRIGLLQQRLEGLMEKARQAGPPEKTKLDTEIRKLQSDINMFQALVEARVAAYRRVEAAKTPAEIDAAKDAAAESDTTIAFRLAQYGASSVELDDFGVSVTGAGDVASDVFGSGLDVNRILRRGGVRIQGTGDEAHPNRVLRRFSVKGANAKQDEKDSGAVASGDFELGETVADVEVRPVGDSYLIDLKQFSIDSFALSQLLLTADKGDEYKQLGSTGDSRIEGIALQGTIRMDKRKGTKGEFPGDYRPAHVEIKDFHINAVRANGLFFKSSADKVELSIKTGSIEGIWAKGMAIDLPEKEGEKMQILGKAGINQISDVEIAGTFKRAWELRHGRIDGSGLAVGFFKEGEIRATLGDLSATAVSLRGPDGWARFSLNHFGTKLSYKNGVLNVEDIHLGSFEVTGIDWKVGPTGFVKADRPAHIKDVRLSGRIETEETPAKAAPGKTADPDKTERRIKRVKIAKFHVGEIAAEHLIYQDETNRIELKREDDKTPKHMKGFEPLLLKNLEVNDLLWDRSVGLSQGKVSLEHYETSASYSGLKSGLKAGIGLKGGGMKVEVMGPGIFGGSIGKVEKIRGTYHDEKIDSKFGTGSVVGSFTLGPDFVEANNIEVDGLMFGKTTYNDPPGRALTLSRLNVDKIKLGKVRQNYEKSTDALKPEEKVPTTLSVENLEFQNIHAGEFDYQGSAQGKNADGEVETSSQHIKGESATIERLNISEFSHDKATAESILSLQVTDDGTKYSRSPFHIHGLAATLASRIGEKEKLTKLTTNVEGGPLTAEKIKFATVKLGTVVGPNGKTEDVTRTRIDGSFLLTRLGFLNPDLTLTDNRGNNTKTTHISSPKSGSIEINNVQPQFLPNGTARVPIGSVIGKNLQIERGGATIEIPLVELENIVLGLQGMDTAKGIDMLAARVGKIHVNGVRLTVVQEHKEKLSSQEYNEAMYEYEEAKKKPQSKLLAPALSGLSGSITGGITLPSSPHSIDLATPKIRGGAVALQGATPFNLGIERNGLFYWRDGGPLNPDGTRFELKHFDTPVPGIHNTGRPADLGRVNIRELVEGSVNGPSSAPEQTYKPKDWLKYLRLGGNFTLGDGRIGLDDSGDGNLGAGDSWIDFEKDKDHSNRISLQESNLAETLHLEVPKLRLRGAGFTAGETQDGKQRIGKTGAISLEGIHIYAEGLAGFKLTITLYVRDGVIENTEIGDMTFLDANVLKQQKAPTAKDVNPKAVEGAAPAKP